jgi:hypothetical protein
LSAAKYSKEPVAFSYQSCFHQWSRKTSLIQRILCSSSNPL